MKPKTSTPPKTPTTINSSGRLALREIRIGLRKLSTLLMPNIPHNTMNTAQPVWPPL